MKRFLTGILTLAALAACKPEEYTGPLDSPVGNWDGVKTDYYFNGKMVGEAEGCMYPAISFYQEGLCCIEGVKGTFPYIYDHSSGLLQIDNTYWKVQTMTGAEMVIEYIETVFPEDSGTQQADENSAGPSVPEDPIEPDVPEVKPDANGIIIPTSYAGISIFSDKNGYYYESGSKKVYCNFFGGKDDTGTLIIDFWYDRHIDHFIPLVVEAKK